jgi:hypothetical protein
LTKFEYGKGVNVPTFIWNSGELTGMNSEKSVLFANKTFTWDSEWMVTFFFASRESDDGKLELRVNGKGDRGDDGSIEYMGSIISWDSRKRET